MQGNPNSEFLKSFFLWNLGNIDGRIRDPELWNRESTAWNPESGTFLNSLIWDDKAMLSPQMLGETGIHSCPYFIHLGSVISDEDCSLGGILK